MILQEFVKTRYKTWFELLDGIRSLKDTSLRRSGERNLLTLIRLYRKTLSDLSLARTWFPFDRITREINDLVVETMMFLGKPRENDLARIAGFYRVRFPQLVLRLSRLFIVSVAIFAASAAFGFFVSQLNPFAANAIVGDHYIYQTLDNIHKGRPFDIYQSHFRYVMSSFIMANNIKVAFMAFAMGVFYGIGTFSILILNGLMLGAIAAVFAQNNLLVDFISTVMIHGTLELFAILVAGAAGLRLGQALFRPGHKTRGEALREFGIEAFHMTCALIPLFVIAGILEGYVTPMLLPMKLRIVIIASSFAFLALYFIFPALYYLHNQKRTKVLHKPALRLAV